MSFTMEQYNEALLSVIDKNKRYAIEALQKPTTVYKTEGFKNILYTLMVAPQLQDSQSVLDFLNRDTLESSLAETINNLIDEIKVKTSGKTDELTICRVAENLYLDSFCQEHDSLLNAMIDAFEQDGWNVKLYKDYPGYFEIERWTDGTEGHVILCIDLRSKGLDSPSNWKDEINDVVDSWDVRERSILELQFAPDTPSLSEIIKDFQDFKDNELSRLAFITKNVADAWERKSMGNEDLPLLRESHNLSAKCARITDISHNFSMRPKDEPLTHDGENTNR